MAAIKDQEDPAEDEDLVEDIPLGDEEDIAPVTFSPEELIVKKQGPNEYYSLYQQNPTNQNLGLVVKSLDPVINKTLVALGEVDNPLLKNQAKLYATRAIKKFDPSHGAQIHTWVANQLMQLRRARRSFNSPIKVPERIQLDAYTLDKKSREFVEQHGREPELLELSDYAGMPIKRITKVREQFFRVPGAGAISDDTVNNTEADFMHEAVGYVYQDADHLNRKILEHRTGYGGAQMLSNSELSELLGVRPDVISKRSAKLGTKLEHVSTLLRQGYGS